LAIIKRGDASVSTRADNRVALRTSIDGRNRDIIFEADAAQEIGTTLANAGFDCLNSNMGFPVVEGGRLRPFDKGATALIEFSVPKTGGALVLAFDAKQLIALSTIAAAALELGDTSGSA
jgi:hypothetical protein